MGWMHPYYAQLRRQLVEGRLDPRTRALVQVNLERVRVLPASGRYVLVNSAAQRLFMVENGQTVDMMRVVVGKPVYPTPIMAALIRYTSLRPYWNVPSDLAAERIAPNVVKLGLPYLRQKGYQVLSDWSDKAKLVNPASVDWKAVSEGRKEVRLRQLPGPANSMGDMKFMFPNAQGIYLHDTPQEELFGEASRMFSGGCVRLEAAHRLATWLYGRPLRARGMAPEQKVPMTKPVPVYLTYLTVVPSGNELAFYDDIYKWDAAKKQMTKSRRA
jgi:murein L,D-transpeptidase YcbB/YkuD